MPSALENVVQRKLLADLGYKSNHCHSQISCILQHCFDILHPVECQTTVFLFLPLSAHTLLATNLLNFESFYFRLTSPGPQPGCNLSIFASHVAQEWVALCVCDTARYYIHTSQIVQGTSYSRYTWRRALTQDNPPTASDTQQTDQNY